VTDAPLSRESRPKLAPKARLKWDRHENKHMLLYPERGMLLNETAAAIVQACDGQRTIAEIAVTIASAGKVDASAVERDVLDFVESLRVRALLESF
jgi:coenzyme PQQ biosynthesis protein PqqD